MNSLLLNRSGIVPDYLPDCVSETMLRLLTPFHIIEGGCWGEWCARDYRVTDPGQRGNLPTLEGVRGGWRGNLARSTPPSNPINSSETVLVNATTNPEIHP